MKIKPSLLVAVGALAAAGVGALDLKFEFNSHSEEAKDGQKPDNGDGVLYACVVKSTTCKSTSHYTSVVFDPHLELTECHHDGLFKNFFNRLMPTSGRGAFINTFYVSCPRESDDKTGGKDGEKEGGGEESDCKKVQKKKGFTSNQIRDILAEGFDVQTGCDASVKCYDLKMVDERCFPMVAEEEDEGEE